MPFPYVCNELIMADTKKRRKLNYVFYKISELSPSLSNWKTMAKVKELVTTAEHQRSLNSEGKLTYLLEDDSGKILISFGENAEKLESLNLQMNKEYYVSGAEFKTSNRKFHLPVFHKYELEFGESTVIEPVEGDLSPCVGPFPSTAKPAGSQAESSDNGKGQFRSIPLKAVIENKKSGSSFDVMGFFKKISQPERTSTFYVQRIWLTDTTGEVILGLSAKYKYMFKKLKKLKDQVIGVKSCHWTSYHGQDYINADLDKLYEEHELLEVDVQKLKDWYREIKPSFQKASKDSDKSNEEHEVLQVGVQNPQLTTSPQKALQEPPYFDKWNITTDTEGLTIYCSYGVPEGSPSVCEIKWTKNGETLDLRNKKYVEGQSNDGSRLNERYLTISYPALEDKGNYICTVTNAEGSVSKDVTLDVPSADISIDSEVMFGLNTTITSAVLSCPTADKVEWQKSNDGKTFCRIDIREPRYYGSSLSPESPLLVIPYTTLDDMLHYRLRVWNKIGDQCSNTLYLNVTRGPPNIMTNHQICLKRRTVTLFCEVFPYDPENVFWSINGKEIDYSKSKVKYSEVTVEDPSLTIFNVNEDAAGSYQVTASNAEGSTQSDVIVLAKPQIDFERTENTDGSQVFIASMDSIPSAYHAQWKVKGKDDETYTPVKDSTEEYKGTSNSLPCPVLVLKQRELLENKCFLIEVENFVGKSVKEILWKEFTEEGKESDSRVLSSDKELGRDRGKNILQREAAAKKMLTAEEEKIMDEAKYITLSRPSTAHLFSKGAQNQKEVLPSIVRAEVSKSVGLIYINGKVEGTGFRVGEKYILTCEHVIKDAKVTDHIICIGRVSIEFGRISNTPNRDYSRIFDIISMVYVDKEHDFVVLELDAHQSGVPFPPALTCFGQVCWPDVHLVGHPNCTQMMEDSVIPFWLPEHNDIAIPYIDTLSRWSKIFFPGDNDHYEELRYIKPRKIMFHTTFNHGSSGSPGVMIRDEKPCVVLMVRGGVPVCVYENIYPDLTPIVQDNQKLEYGYAMEDIYMKMRNSSQEKDRKLASEIFQTW